MLNKEGFERDLAILKEWKDHLTSEYYLKCLKELYSDYGLNSEGK